MYVGASDSGQQEVVGERRQLIKAAIRGLVEAARPDLSPAQVDAVVAEMNKRMTMGSKQCCLTAILCLSMLLQSFLGQPTEGFPAAAAVFEQPSSAWPVAKLKELDEMHLTGDGNSLNANATTIITSINEFYRHPGRFIKWWLDRDTNACLNFQRIGESKQRPLELCRWDDLEALPPVGKEYQQGYKRVNDRLPKAVEPDFTDAQRNKKASGEARAARDKDNTNYGRKCNVPMT
ncbi:hypothetical protein QJQ45_009865 [Haematococcus lacustris]|nr:hypothetical protein QJQ45_009865 [Haematococcus lacustris]